MRNSTSFAKLSHLKHQLGFSLIEIFIALAIGLVLFAGVMSVFVGMRTTTEETSSYGEMQENGRFAISLFTDDLLRAGFFGDMAENFSFSALVTAPADFAANRYYLMTNQNAGAIFAGNGAIPNINQGRSWEYQHHIYYVRNDNQGSNKVPVLVQGQLRNGTLPPIDFSPIIDGIEMIRFMYGVDTDDDGVVNAFIAADNMTEAYWDNESNVKILAVKIYVLVRDILPDNNYENKSTYTLGDLAVNFIDGSGNGDHYRRLLFTSTVAMPNARTDKWP